MTNGICMHCGKEVKLSKKGKVARHKAKTAMAGGTHYDACQGSSLQALTKENLEAHLRWLKNIAETNINGQFAIDTYVYLTERHSGLLPWVAGGLNYIELSNEADSVQAELAKLGAPEALRAKIDCLLRRGVEDACKITRANQRVEEMQRGCSTPSEDA